MRSIMCKLSSRATLEERDWTKVSRGDFEREITKCFPLLYADMHGDMRVTCMTWGIDTSSGWYDIIYNLSSKLEPLIQKWIDKNPKPADDDGSWCYPKAMQAKEKFGGLRFYMTFETDEMQDLIDEAEAEAWETCEFCGTKENVFQTSGWIVTLCKSCDEKRNENRKKFNEENS